MSNKVSNKVLQYKLTIFPPIGSVGTEKLTKNEAIDEDSPMDNGAPNDKLVASTKRKRTRTSASKLEKRNLKNKKIKLDDVDQISDQNSEEDLESSLSSISTDVSSNSSTKINSKNSHTNDNIIAKQPPIIVTPDDKHTA